MPNLKVLMTYVMRQKNEQIALSSWVQQENCGQETEVAQGWYDNLSLGVGGYKKSLGECGDETSGYGRRKVKRVKPESQGWGYY